MNIWTLGTLWPNDLDGKTPPGYHHAENDEDRAPGLYGQGAGGEALVCLLPNDDGAWFEKLAKSKDPSAIVRRG